MLSSEAYDTVPVRSCCCFSGGCPRVPVDDAAIRRGGIVIRVLFQATQGDADGSMAASGAMTQPQVAASLF